MGIVVPIRDAKTPIERMRAALAEKAAREPQLRREILAGAWDDLLTREL